MKITLISFHDGASPRKTGFHFWAEILAARGHDVRFLTVGSSLISLFKKNGKQLVKPFNQWVSIAPNIKKYTWVPVIHPFNTGKNWLDTILIPAFKIFPFLFPSDILNDIRDSDYFIVESGAGPLLMPKIVKAAPKAKFIYNLSDKFSVVKFHPLIIKGNLDSLGYFDLIRLNAESAASELPQGIKATYIPQAIDKKLFDDTEENPYKSPRNAISVGDMLFDARAIETLARSFPEWNFHVFGKRATLGTKWPNVTEYGEVPFSKLVPYIKFADIGLAPYSNAPDIGYLSQSSLKFAQYTYSRLPIVAPEATAAGRMNILPYKTSDDSESLATAFQKAIVFDRNTIDKNSVPSWEEMIDTILSLADKSDKKR